VAKVKMKLPATVARMSHEEYENRKQSQTKLGQRLDEIVGCNTLTLIIDDALHERLKPDMLDDDDWKLIAHSGLVDLSYYRTGDTEAIFMALMRSLYGLTQYFLFSGEEITDNWPFDMHEMMLMDFLYDEPLTDDSTNIAYYCRDLGMNQLEIFALMGYLYPEGSGSVH